MGDPKRQKRKFTRPYKRWDKNRIIEEHGLMRTYGLKNKKELWRARAELRSIRANARALLAASGEEKERREKELLSRLYRLGLLPKDATLDDVLSLDVRDILERRLQTMVWRKGFARTIHQARQFVVHGHVYVDGRRVTIPSYWVKRDEEDRISLDPEVLAVVQAPQHAPQAVEQKLASGQEGGNG
ncbi:MAG TPA: 30S ribosomal protein S4 [Euryarchaeota archaeon]|nr:30S ribosomal protein S4 [Euryarchaeota archaeon]HIQ10025.1 30S ribosomal protein S4 [Euryarchaeota archaeon]